MGKFTFFLVSLGGILLFSFNKSTDSDCGTYASNSRYITCGSCHGGSINTDIVIIGKDDEDIIEEDNNNPNIGVIDPRLIRLVVKIPNFITSTALQINAYGNNTSKFSLNGIKPLFTDKQGAQLALMPIGNFNGKKGNEITIYWEAPEVFNEPQTIEIQGVFANMDGTEGGDYSFYNEVTLYPKKVKEIDREVSIYPTIASSTLNIVGLNENDEVRIFDMAGKLILQRDKQENNLAIDVSNLSNGGYFATISDGKHTQSAKFVVQK